ncbi:MAG TPA: hypothetical protein PJ990_04230 [Saprospiraceae bacterium]|nr:hypothetical protein [Saprospiraceae bacterium]
MNSRLDFTLDIKNSFYQINRRGYCLISNSTGCKEYSSMFSLYNNNGELIIQNIVNQDGIVHKYNNKFYYFNEKYKIIEIGDLLKEITIIQESDLILESLFNEYFVFTDKYNFLQSNQLETPAIKYIYKLGELIWTYEKFGTIEIFSDDYALCFTDSNPIIDKRTKNQFLLLDLNQKSELWNFNLEDHLLKLNSIHPFDYPHKVGKPLGIYKDQLWFEMDNYGLMCLHKETGELIHYLRDLPYAQGESYRGMPRVEQGYAVIPYTNEAILLEDEGKIICFAIFYYWELDLETMEMSYHYLKDYFKEVECSTFGARFKPLEVAGDLIYMVDTQHKKIGIFNRKTLRYEHIESLPEGSGAPRSIEKHGDRLYKDTFGKKLLVYQI